MLIFSKNIKKSSVYNWAIRLFVLIGFSDGWIAFKTNLDIHLQKSSNSLTSPIKDSTLDQVLVLYKNHEKPFNTNSWNNFFFYLNPRDFKYQFSCITVYKAVMQGAKQSCSNAIKPFNDDWTKDGQN